MNKNARITREKYVMNYFLQEVLTMTKCTKASLIKLMDNMINLFLFVWLTVIKQWKDLTEIR